jgi:Tfp pilus assembly protein PilX
MELSFTWLRSERGIALPMSLGVMVLTAIGTITAFQLAASAQRSEQLSRLRQAAEAAAEAGSNQAASVLASAPNPDTASALPAPATPATFTAGSATVQYSGTLDTAVSPHLWTITSVGSLPDPARGAPVTHTLTTQYQVVSDGITLQGNEAWKYVFSAGASICTVLQNNVVVSAPLYTRGDLCLRNGARVLGPNVDTKGSITVEDPSASVGSSPADASDPAVRAGLGCRFGTSTAPSTSTCGSASRIYGSSYSPAVPDYAKPPVDLAFWRVNAKPGPGQPCTTSAGPVPSFTSTGPVNLLPTSSYTCEVWQDGTLVGRLSWNNTSKVLDVAGVAYFDGQLLLDNDQQATYDGKGTIYVAGTGSLRNSTRVCAVAGCGTTGWDPNLDLLTFVIGSPSLPAFELNNFAKLQGAVYVVGGFIIQNNATMQGPVVADVIDAENSGLSATWAPLTALNPGMPVNNSATPLTVRYLAGSWRG